MDHYLAGDITVKTRWREYSKKVKNDQRYLDLIPAFGYVLHKSYYIIVITNKLLQFKLQIHSS